MAGPLALLAALVDVDESELPLQPDSSSDKEVA
jgi:hypothetical protein